MQCVWPGESESDSRQEIIRKKEREKERRKKEKEKEGRKEEKKVRRKIVYFLNPMHTCSDNSLKQL